MQTKFLFRIVDILRLNTILRISKIFFCQKLIERSIRFDCCIKTFSKNLVYFISSICNVYLKLKIAIEVEFVIIQRIFDFQSLYFCRFSVYRIDLELAIAFNTLDLSRFLDSCSLSSRLIVAIAKKNVFRKNFQTRLRSLSNQSIAFFSCVFLNRIEQLFQKHVVTIRR